MGWLCLVVGLAWSGVAIVLLIAENFVWGILLLVFSIYFLAGLRSVQQQERWVIELFGRYVGTLRPGLQWILPGIMQVRAVVSVWEQMLPLFETPIKIDFRDGSAVPKEATAFVRVLNPDDAYILAEREVTQEDGTTRREVRVVRWDEELSSEDRIRGDYLTGVYRAIYEIGDWRKAIRNQLENALRSYLNGLTIDEGITMARAGYELLNRLPSEERGRIGYTLHGWGFELLRVTIGDFDLEPEIVRARGGVQIRQREAEAARHEALVRARETAGTLIAMMAEISGRSVEEIQQEINRNSELQTRLQAMAEDLVSRQVSIAGKALTDIRVSGGGDIEQGLLRIVAALRTLPREGA